MTAPKLTSEQAAILSAHTGILCGDFNTFHRYVEQVMQRPVFTHEMADKKVCEEIKAKSKSDFLAIQPEGVAFKQEVTP